MRQRRQSISFDQVQEAVNQELQNISKFKNTDYEREQAPTTRIIFHESLQYNFYDENLNIGIQLSHYAFEPVRWEKFSAGNGFKKKNNWGQGSCRESALSCIQIQ